MVTTKDRAASDISSITIPLSLSASPSGRHLVSSHTGAPFLWAADTAWSLFHVCDNDEVVWYLETRKSQGFTVILAVLLSEHGGFETPNAHGEYIFEQDAGGKRQDPSKPNDRYFKHVDWVVEQAAKRGLTICMVPTWGKYINSGWAGCKTLIFNDENAAVFGDYIGNRYPGLPKIIGGDTNPYWFDTSDIWPAVKEGRIATIPTITDSRSIMRAMARAILKAEQKFGINAFQTYHPTAMWLPNHPEARAAAFFPDDDDWLSMDAVQSGHSSSRTITTDPLLSWWNAYTPHVAIDIMWNDASESQGSLTGKRPVLDLEGHYEGMTDGFSSTTPHYFDATDIRNGTWSSVFSGACGWVYGANSVWQMYEPGRDRETACGLSSERSWKEDLQNFKGAPQLVILKTLLLTVDREASDSRVPDQSCLAEGPSTGKARISVTRDGRLDPVFLWAYSGQGQPFKLDLSCFKNCASLTAHWLNPETGTYEQADLVGQPEVVDFLPPTQDHDWVLDIRCSP